MARRLRELPGDSTYPDLIGVIADHDGWYPASDAADRLADLIEPSGHECIPGECPLNVRHDGDFIDRDALLALADDMGRVRSRCESCNKARDCDWVDEAVCLESYIDDCADRIREACGVVDAG